MSDDIPLIFAEDILGRSGLTPRAVFLSAVSTAQMQQYATAGWAVMAAAGFDSAGPIDLAAVPATPCDDDAIAGADLLSVELPTWQATLGEKVARWLPACVKVNGAFHGIEDERSAVIANGLMAAGYTLFGCHWRDDNSYGIRSLSRIDALAAFQPPDWKHLNIIAVRDPERARTLMAIGRLYVGEERRIAELRVGHRLRGDHIGRLEDALMAHQQPR